jgi:hypothetical protein
VAVADEAHAQICVSDTLAVVGAITLVFIDVVRIFAIVERFDILLSGGNVGKVQLVTLAPRRSRLGTLLRQAGCTHNRRPVMVVATLLAEKFCHAAANCLGLEAQI